MSFEKNHLCYLCGLKFTENQFDYHKIHCLRRWRDEHTRALRSQLNPSSPMHKSSIFPLIHSRNQIERDRNVYESAKIEVLNCAKCAPCVACRAEALGKGNNLIIKQPELNNIKTTVELPSTRDSNQINYFKNESQVFAQKDESINTCYICGYDFDKKNLNYHESVCLNNWNDENNKLPHQIRRPTPEKPNLNSQSYPDFAFMKIKAKTENIRIFLQQHNLGSKRHTMSRGHTSKIRQNLKEVANDVQKAILIPCQRCGRKILPHRFNSHVMTCIEPRLKPTSSQSDFRPVTNNVPVICYICGRKYGKASIESHEFKCSERWKRIHLGKALPEKKVIQEIKKEVSIELTEAEKELWRALYAPVDCSCCGNNFTPESFVVHELNCFYFEKTKIKKKEDQIEPLNKEHKRPTTPNGSITSRSNSSSGSHEKEETRKEKEGGTEKWYCPNCTSDRVTICASSILYKNLYNLY